MWEVKIDENITISIIKDYIYSNCLSWNILRFPLKIALHSAPGILFLTIWYNNLFPFYSHPCDLIPAHSHFIAIHAYYSLLSRAQKQ